jgi:hypothetical protein
MGNFKMNERIKNLAKQCYVTGPIGKDGWPEYSRFDEEKFAKLIVKECCNEIAQEPFNAGDASIWLRDHFGTEQ